MKIATKSPASCTDMQDQFSNYLDGLVSGRMMQEIAAHLEECSGCSDDFAAWRGTLETVAALGPAKAPEDLGLRLRVALSQAAAHTPRAAVDRWRIEWANVYRPFALRATAGLASAVCLIGTAAMLVGMFATPQPVEARDEPFSLVTAPRFLYTSAEPDLALNSDAGPVIVEAFVNKDGRVYSYSIVSGEADQATRAQLDNTLLFSLFEPATSFGIPVRGTVVMLFSGISVKG